MTSETFLGEIKKAGVGATGSELSKMRRFDFITLYPTTVGWRAWR